MPSPQAGLGPRGALGGITHRRTVRMAEILGSPQWIPEDWGTDNVEFADSFVDMYPRASLKARVIWSTTQTSAGAITFRLRYAKALPNSEEYPSLSAMNTIIAKDPIIGTSANDIQKTEWGVISPGSVGPRDEIKFRLDVLSASSLTVGAKNDNVKVYGVEFEYMIGATI